MPLNQTTNRKTPKHRTLDNLKTSSKSQESQQNQQCSTKDCLETPQLLSVAAAFQKPEAEDDEQNEPSKRESLREKKLITQQM